MNHESQKRRVTRRQVLRYGGGIAVGTASALAGCSALNLGTGPIKSVTVEPVQVVVTLTESADIDILRLRPPGNEDPLSPTSVGPDQTTVELPLLRSPSGSPIAAPKVPPPGVYTVEALRNEEVIATKKTDRITSNPRIAAIRAQISENRATGNILFTVTTSGMLPTKLTHLSITGVPNPLDTDLVATSLTGTAIDRVTQTDLPQNARLLVVPTVENTFVINEAPLQLSVDTYQKYVRMDTEYPQLPEPCKTRQWSGKLTVTTVRSTLTAPFVYSFDGKTHEAGFGYMCSGASISLASNTTDGNATNSNSTEQ